MLHFRCCTGFSLAVESEGYSLAALPRLLVAMLWSMGLVILQHVGSSPVRDWSHFSCLGRQILYLWATREALSQHLFRVYSWLQTFPCFSSAHLLSHIVYRLCHCPVISRSIYLASPGRTTLFGRKLDWTQALDHGQIALHLRRKLGYQHSSLFSLFKKFSLLPSVFISVLKENWETSIQPSFSSSLMTTYGYPQVLWVIGPICS